MALKETVRPERMEASRAKEITKGRAMTEYRRKPSSVIVKAASRTIRMPLTMPVSQERDRTAKVIELFSFKICIDSLSLARCTTDVARGAALAYLGTTLQQ